ncbi:MAG: DUF4440 domain-containing protein [Nitrospirota bacterium]|nr:MAG: DUF4440 domain-containing protein [Nitrospirota bacterium]
MIKTPEIILKQWAEYINKLEVENVVKLYGSGCTLLPTFSSQPLSTPEELKEYFTNFSKRKNVSVNIHNETLKKYELSKDRYALVGTYSFSFMVDDKQLTFPSRFTFILDTSKESPILHHHSSQIPEDGVKS